MAPAAGDAATVAAAFFVFNHECLPGDGEAAAGDTPLTAALGTFFICLCLDALGDAPGLGLDVALCANTADTEKAVNAMIRGMSFFIEL